MTPADRRIAVGLFIVAFVTFAYFSGGGGWNQNAQFDLTRALVERQTLHIDDFRKNTGDISWSDTSGTWHAYANKPPGVSLLAAIPYALIYRWQLSTPTNAYLVTLLTCGVCGALIPVVIYAYARRRVKATPLTSVCVALSIAFGTIVFPYSTMLFAHVPSALFLLLAFVYLDEKPFLAGLAAGMASICFYVCIPAALVLGVVRASGASPAQRRAGGAHHSTLLFLLGGLPFALLLGAYHSICFGSPWRTSVAGSKAFTQEGLLFGVLRKPSGEALWGLTFSEYRGLFFVSPILLIAFIGAAIMIRRKIMLRELATVAAIFVIFLLVNTSFNGWEGGFAFGPRYLMPAIPLLAIPMLFAWRNILLIVVAVSVAIQFLATAVDPMPDGGIRQPLRAHLIPAFTRGEIARNAQGIEDLLPRTDGTRGAFNLGERVLPRAHSWIPIALWLIAGSAWLVHRARRA